MADQTTPTLQQRLQDLETAVAGAINALATASAAGQGVSLTADQTTALKTLTDLIAATGGNLEAVINEAVVFSPMTLTDSQQAQVRTNIGAVSADDIDAAISKAVEALPTAGGVDLPDFDHATNFVKLLGSADLQHAALLAVQNSKVAASTQSSSAAVPQDASSQTANASPSSSAPAAVQAQPAAQAVPAQPAYQLATA